MDKKEERKKVVYCQQYCRVLSTLSWLEQNSCQNQVLSARFCPRSRRLLLAGDPTLFNSRGQATVALLHCSGMRKATDVEPTGNCIL